MKYLLIWFLSISLFFVNKTLAQNTLIKGEVLNDSGNPIPYVNIYLQNQTSTQTNEKGAFLLNLPINKTFTLRLTCVGYKEMLYDITTKNEANTRITIQLVKQIIDIGIPVVIRTKTHRNEVSMQRLDIKNIDNIATAGDGVSSMIKTLPGVVSNNELTSQYAVRGGNYDENLIFINDFEIYKPQLVSASQQEGLSVYNPNLIKSLVFSSGGFQPRYGDKMSSVLNINYKRPYEPKGTLIAGLLNQSFHIEGTNKNKNLKFLIGARNRTTGLLLRSQELKGEYQPNASDLQTFITYDLSPKITIEALGYYSINQFKYQPLTRSTKFGVVNNVKSFDVRYDTESAENDRYKVFFGGLGVTFTPNNKLKMKWIASAYQANEVEKYNIIGAYKIADVETDLGSSDFAETKSLTGYGYFQNWARNQMVASIFTLGYLSEYNIKNHVLQWGVSTKAEQIVDKINEWDRIDSSGFVENGNWMGGYTVPYAPFNQPLLVNNVIKQKNETQGYRISAFIQDTWSVTKSYTLNLTYGLRANYTSYNGETTVAPRLQLAYYPNWKQDWAFKLASGLYTQPPFFREMRRRDGTLNENVKSQKAVHFVAGADYIFTIYNRDFKITTEAYYKHLLDINPYEIDNVLIRYFGNNDAIGYATGLDFRINGEFIPGAESWFSVSLLQTKEKNKNETYYRYKYENGLESTIKNNDIFNPIVDSTFVQAGYVARPTNQVVNMAIFFQDYLPKNKNFKGNLTLNFGSGLPFGPADGKRWNDLFYTSFYIRADLGVSALLFDKSKQEREPNKITKVFNRIWLTAEIFNILDNNNTISYSFFKDFSNREYGIPNRLTSRRLSTRLMFEF